MAATMHLAAILRLSNPLEQLGVGEIECGVLVGGRGLSPHQRAGADEGEFDAVVAGIAAALGVA